MDMLADCGKKLVAQRLAFERPACKALQQSVYHLAVIKNVPCSGSSISVTAALAGRIVGKVDTGRT
ncbi:hypothetical protein [Aquidulcibacter paucihalophilus]|uniref:hypothetical protein n=1 Tax=Aquidulcibacter paucihalophilus TaxID=1978549 RepID=UPI0012FF8DA4|nr:hypothetical protein [Aquidulcibacter paucihalophilus]